MARLRETFLVRFAVNKPERVSRDHFRIQLFAIIIVENLLETLVRADAKVIVAVVTDLQVFFQLALVEMLAAFFAADEDILSADDALRLAHRLDLSFFLTKPRHKNRNQKSE